jgi:hypothetical protein
VGFIDPVKDYYYSICGNFESSTGHICFGAGTILAAATALQANCSDAVMVGGNVAICQDITLQL